MTSVIGVRGSSSQFIVEYVWGLLGPIVRIDLQNPANTRYYVIDGLGHVRALVAPNGAITEVWHYDSWGNILSMPAQRMEQPFLWNGAYGYEYIPFTGLYPVAAREYDPRTARWLQRDPIGVAGGHPNVYLYSKNDPVNLADPSGLSISWWDAFKRWYMEGMGGVSEWVDQNLMFDLTERYGNTVGRYDCGQASGWEVVRDGTLWAGGLLLVGLLSFTPADEATGAAVSGVHGIQRARQLGQRGEQVVGIYGQRKTAIVDRAITRTPSGWHVPDRLDHRRRRLIEVENVNHLD